MSSDANTSANAALEAIFDLVKLPNTEPRRLADGSIDPARVIPRVVELNAAYQQALQQRDAFRAQVIALGGDPGATDYALPEPPAPAAPHSPKDTSGAPDCSTCYLKLLLTSFAEMGDQLYPGMHRILSDKLQDALQRETDLVFRLSDLQDRVARALVAANILTNLLTPEAPK